MTDRKIMHDGSNNEERLEDIPLESLVDWKFHYNFHFSKPNGLELIKASLKDISVYTLVQLPGRAHRRHIRKW